MSKTYILVVETVSKNGSLSLFSDNDQEIGFLIGSVENKLSADLIGMISELLDKHQVNLSETNSIVITDGPGSFTGLRVGWAFVKGIAAGLKIPYFSASVLDALFEDRLNSVSPDCTFISIGGGKIVCKYKEDDNFITMSVNDFLKEASKHFDKIFITIEDTYSTIFTKEDVPLNIRKSNNNIASLVFLALKQGKEAGHNVRYFG